MPHAYTEDQLVEQPAKRLLAELGWGLAQPHPHPDPLPEGEGEELFFFRFFAYFEESPGLAILRMWGF